MRPHDLSKLFFISLAALTSWGCNSNHTYLSLGENTMEKAKLITLTEKEGYDEVVITNHEGRPVAHYALVSRDDNRTKIEGDDIEVIRVPLEKVVVDSEIYASAFEELGASDIIKGIFDARYATSPQLKEKIEMGKIENVGQANSPNIEKIVSLQPDALMVSYYDGMQMEGVDRLGTPIIKMYDLQENTPLGRAEWLRFIGRLVGKGETADSIYTAVAKEYEALAHEGVDTKSVKPKVLTDLIYEGVWYVPGGGSYQASFIKDAGGRYFKEDDREAVTLNLSAEQVLTQGGDSEIWIIKHFGDEKDLRKILASDPVYMEIKAYKNGTIYYSDTSRSALFREFPFHPERLLKDYRYIMRGDSIQNMRYFRKL